MDNFSEASVASEGEAGTNHAGDSYHLQNTVCEAPGLE